MKAHELAYLLNFANGHAEVGVRVRSGRVLKIKDVDSVSPIPMFVIIELSDEELPVSVRVCPDEENDE